MIEDGYQTSLSEREAALLELTDLLIGLPRSIPADLAERLSSHFKPDEVAEVTLGVGLFLGMSKVLIGLGLEPEEMGTTIVPTPGS